MKAETPVLCVLLLLRGATPAVADPPIDYVLHCRGCHGPDGSGVSGGAPAFRGQVAKFVWVPGGREYLIRVPGTAQSELSDARVAALLNWLLREFSAAELPADFVPYSGAEVARHRRPALVDVAGARHDLIRAIEATSMTVSDLRGPDGSQGAPHERRHQRVEQRAVVMPAVARQLGIEHGAREQAPGPPDGGEAVECRQLTWRIVVEDDQLGRRAAPSLAQAGVCPAPHQYR